MKLLLLSVLTVLSNFAMAAIQPQDLKNSEFVGRSDDGSARLVIKADLKWTLQLTVGGQQKNFSGNSVLTSPGFDHSGTLVILSKSASNPRDAETIALGTRATDIDDLETLEYSDLILIRQK